MHVVTTILVLVVVRESVSLSSTDATYAVYFPQYIRPGFVIQVVAEVFQSPNPVKVSASLNSPAKEINYNVEAIVIQGEPKLLTFSEQIPIGYDGTTDFTMTVSGLNTVTDEVIFSNSTDELIFKPKSLSIFIQTDKGIYKASHTIKFRAVVTNPDLLPHSGNVTYKLTDPDDNIILQKKYAPLVNGIAGDEFKLGRYSTLGEWKISFECEGNEEKVTVTVDEYQLPKFEIEFRPDQAFLHPDSTRYSGEIGAKFTFGQPVKGEASIRLETVTYDYSSIWGGRRIVNFAEIPFPNFTGKAKFNVLAKELYKRLKWDPKQRRYQSMTATVTVTDKNSLISLNETQTVSLVRVPITAKKENAPDTYKQGFFYTGYIKLEQYDGSKITEQQRQSFGLKISAKYTNYTPKYTQLGEDHNVTIDKNGYVAFTFRTDNRSYEYIQFTVKSTKYPNSYFLTWTARPFNSPSHTYIQISSAKSSLKSGENAVLHILTTRNDVPYSVLMLSRGIIVKQQTYTPVSYEHDGLVYQFQYQFAVTTDMAPSVTIAFFFMADNGEIVTDNVAITVETTLANPVSLKPSVKTTETGTPINITVETSPYSTVALRAIDRSVILLKDGNDINMKKILDDIDEYSKSFSTARSSGYFWFPWRSDGTNAKELFRDAGIIVFTDASTYVSQYASPPLIYEGVFLQNDIMFDMAESAMPSEGAFIIKKDSSTPKVRKNFPETWIWKEVMVGASGKHTFAVDLPDTTTTWEINAVSVSQNEGIGVSNPDAQVIASRDFFISTTFPSSVVSGEVVNVRVSVYNYKDVDVTALLTLEESDWYDIVMNGNDTSIEGYSRRIAVPSKDGKTEIFAIRFLKSGVAKIKFTAISELASDALERTLPVKPEGLEQDISESALIDRADANEPDTVTIFPVLIPSGIVEGSVYGKLSVSGSVMGNSWNNLGNLLQLPTGCGEQTMLSFAPDVFVSLYLQKVGLLNGEMERKSSSHIRSGYQNELRYQHSDGAFSAFGTDKHGSTWLTAFVVKSFIAARKLSTDFVQEDKLDPAINFLLSTQLENGQFKENGLVRHKDMQGGVSSDKTMTAYVLIALAEEGYKKDRDNISSAIAKARQYLENHVADTTDTYALSIIAYALSVSGSSEASNTLNRLDERARISGNMKYWSVQETEQSCDTLSRWDQAVCWRSSTTASDIEMTSYILLSLMKLGKTQNIMPIVRWLIKQRGSLGGYRSTQDTVLAIQTLSVFAGLYSDDESNLSLEVRHSGVKNFSSTMTITKENAIILQSLELPAISGDVSITTKGVGVADIQMSYQYYISLKERADEPFSVTVDLVEENGLDKVQMKICSSINKNAKNPLKETGMFVVAVKMWSGYSSNDKEASEHNKNAKLFELDGDELTGYFDKLTTGEEICFKVGLDRHIKIANIKPQLIRAFDYYSPEAMSVRMYAAKGSDDMCKVFGTDMHGCSGAKATTVVYSLLASIILTLMSSYFIFE